MYEINLSHYLVRLSLGDALEWCRENGYTLRVVRLDGLPCIGTRDFRRDRVNVAVQDGVVVEVTGIG